jgi:hypothetical protein
VMNPKHAPKTCQHCGACPAIGGDATCFACGRSKLASAAPTLGTCDVPGNVMTARDADPFMARCRIGLSCKKHGVKERARDTFSDLADFVDLLPDVGVR